MSLAAALAPNVTLVVVSKVALIDDVGTTLSCQLAASCQAPRLPPCHATVSGADWAQPDVAAPATVVAAQNNVVAVRDRRLLRRSPQSFRINPPPGCLCPLRIAPRYLGSMQIVSFIARSHQRARDVFEPRTVRSRLYAMAG